MSDVVHHEVRRGAYFDSIVLMQLQSGLLAQPEIRDAAAVMATSANLALLDASGLLPADTSELRSDDLVVAVRARADAEALAALGAIDTLVARRAGDSEDGEDGFQPRSLRTALGALPDANWVAISVPGRYAASVARDAVRSGRNVFLYSDNVSLADEVELKRRAAERGLMVMGPDCGTAVVGGVGMGFANRVRAGHVGLVGASGTGLQAIASAIHERGAGVSHAFGTGGRDLDPAVGGATTLQALAALGRDRATEVVVLVSKPPKPEIAARVLAAARATGKPVVVCFLGLVPPVERVGSIRFARGLSDAARLACAALEADDSASAQGAPSATGYLRGLFAGGTLAYEALLQLRMFAAPLSSNTPIDGVARVEDPAHAEGHAVLDLGSDEYTVGRLHPMIDPDLRLRRLQQEVADPAVGTVLLDVVLGVGGHADPASGLAAIIAEALESRPTLRILVMVVGTGDDPQDRGVQIEVLRAAGAEVFVDVSEALAAACGAIPAPPMTLHAAGDSTRVPKVVNVGLEHFHDSLVGQGATAVHVAWRPPAGGDERLAALIERMKA